jgi:uncharacterized repeat protein (TIGR02543 family)
MKSKKSDIVFLGALLMVAHLMMACSSNALLTDIQTKVGAAKSGPSVTEFGITSPVVASGTVSGTSITVAVPYGTKVTALVATFTVTTGDSVKVGSTVQVSGITANDFTNPVTYTVTTASGSTQTYVVTVVFTYSVTYNGNGSTGGRVPVDSASPYLFGATVTVLGNIGGLVNIGYLFNGWNTAANGSGTSYATGAHFTMGTSNITLYAQWTNSAGGTTTVSTPGTYTVTIGGGTTLQYSTSATFTSTYTGTATSYQWYLNGAAVSGATASSLTITPTYGLWAYGPNLITLLVTDADGLVYSGGLAVTVTN